MHDGNLIELRLSNHRAYNIVLRPKLLDTCRFFTTTFNELLVMCFCEIGHGLARKVSFSSTTILISLLSNAAKQLRIKVYEHHHDVNVVILRTRQHASWVRSTTCSVGAFDNVIIAMAQFYAVVAQYIFASNK